MEESTVKVRWYLSIGFATANREEEYDTGMSREEWDALPEEERENIMRDVVFNYLEWGYQVIE